MSLEKEIWDAKSDIFDPCLVNIAVKPHGIGLKILP